jgi:hypothetical protein
MNTKQFKVASISQNTNNFGHNGLILLAQDGEAWECSVYLPTSGMKKGKTLDVPLDTLNRLAWEKFGFEVPNKLRYAPPNVVKEVWGSTAEQKIVELVGQHLGLKLVYENSGGDVICCKDRHGKRHVIIGSCANGRDFIVRGIVKQRGCCRMRWLIHGEASTGTIQVGGRWGEDWLWIKDYRTNPEIHVPYSV